MNLGDRLKTARDKKKMTQKALGDTIGVSQSVIHKYEKNLSEPNTANIQTLARVLGITTDYLLFGHDNFDENEFEVALMVIRQLPVQEKAALQVLFKGLITANKLNKKYEQLIIANN